MSNPAVNSTKNLSSTAAAATGKAKETMSKAKDYMKNLYENKGPIIIFILVVVLVFIIVIIYITFVLKNSALKGKVLTTTPLKLDEMSVPYDISSSDIPQPSVGREYSYSFWLYVNQFDQTPENNKLIFYRGAKDDISQANLLAMMDSSENKLYLCVKTQDNNLDQSLLMSDSTALSSAVDLRKIVSTNYFANPTTKYDKSNKYIILEVDYVPLQRWVNFTLILDNKIMTLFMDGEMYSVKSVDEVKAYRKPELDNAGNQIKVNLILDKADGNIYIGKNTINNRITMNGYLSKLEFHNYAVSINQVRSIYNQGPLAKGGILGSIGIPYGFRSPIYKLDTSVNN